MYKLFVGGLPFSTSDDELAQIFGAHGAIASAVVVKDRDTGRSKGFGFVEFENDEEGKAAEKALHNSDLGGRAITVNEARPKEDRPRRDFGVNGGGNGGGNGGSFRQRSW
jgi:RNA recognition motif-containing protein